MRTEKDLGYDKTTRSGRWRGNPSESKQSLFGIKSNKRLFVYSSDRPNNPVWSIDEIYTFGHVDSTKSIIDGFISRYGLPIRSFRNNNWKGDVQKRLVYTQEVLDLYGTKPDATFICSVQQNCKRDTIPECQSEGAVFKKPFMTIDVWHDRVKVSLSDTSFLSNYPIPNRSKSRCDTPSGPMISE